MCFAWSVLYDLSLWFLVYHNHPFCTHLLRKPYMVCNLLEYSMCFTYIFWARQFLLIVLHLDLFEHNNFCSSASLISFRAWWWICFKETIDLSCFTLIILRVVNSMVICLILIYLVFKISKEKKSYECVEYYEKFDAW